jgi:hypothetical protein
MWRNAAQNYKDHKKWHKMAKWLTKWGNTKNDTCVTQIVQNVTTMDTKWQRYPQSDAKCGSMMQNVLQNDEITRKMTHILYKRTQSDNVIPNDKVTHKVTKFFRRWPKMTLYHFITVTLYVILELDFCDSLYYTHYLYYILQLDVWKDFGVFDRRSP